MTCLPRRQTGAIRSERRPGITGGAPHVETYRRVFCVRPLVSLQLQAGNSRAAF